MRTCSFQQPCSSWRGAASLSRTSRCQCGGASDDASCQSIVEHSVLVRLDALADGRFSVASLECGTVQAYIDAAVKRDPASRGGLEASVESGRGTARKGIVTLSMIFGVGDVFDSEVYSFPITNGDGDYRAGSVALLARLGCSAEHLKLIGLSTVDWLNRVLDYEASGTAPTPPT